MECWVVVVSCCLCLMYGAVFGSADGKEIEARRRSSLDKNFMRFGRAYPNPHMLYPEVAAETSKGLERELTKRNSNKETRTPAKGGNLMRFGRAGNSFMRLGRNDGHSLAEDDQEMAAMLMERPQIRATNNNFMRFGRTFNAPPQPPNVFVPAGAIWPLMHQQFGQEEYVDDAEAAVMED